MSRPEGVLTTRGQSFLAAGGVLLGAGLTLGLGDLVRIGLLLVLVSLLAWLVARRPVQWLRVSRVPEPARLTVGEAGEVTLNVVNGRRLRSPFLVAQEQLGYALGDRPRFLVPPLRSGESHAVRYRVRSVVRGEHLLGPLAVRTRDAFGLTNRLTRIAGHDHVLVVPRVLPLSTSGLPGTGPGQDEDVADTVALHGEDDVTIRDYRQGDELRRIHWPASAHTGSLMVRQEEQPSRRRATVVLDRRRSAHAGEGPQASFEWAVTTAASVVAHLLAHGYDVDLVTEAVPRERPVTRDEALEILARAELTDDGQVVAASRAASHRPGGVVVALLGSGHHEGLDQLAGLRRSGTTALALVVDAASCEGARAVREHPDAGTSRRHPDAQQVADRLAAHGWRCTVATGSTHPAEAWGRVAVSSGRGAT